MTARGSSQKINTPLVRQKLQQLGFSQSSIAAKLDVSREIVSQWLKNEKFPRPEMLLRLARLIKLPFDKLVISQSAAFEPVIAFRKKGAHKIPADYIQNAREMGKHLEHLVPYLPFDNLSRPPSFIEPKLDYDYIQAAARETREYALKKSNGSQYFYQHLIDLFIELHAVIIPVLWGNKTHHENALHIYLPKTMTTWIYLNLDSKLHDFQFWMAHELGHIKSPDLREDEAENFADAFAGALLMPGDEAARVYTVLTGLRYIGQQINKIKEVAENRKIAPLTVYYEIKKYARQSRRPVIDLEKNGAIFGANTNFGKDQPSIADIFFNGKKPETSEYIAMPREVFKTPFFDSLKSFIEHTHKSAGYIQTILNLPLVDAQYLYAEL